MKMLDAALILSQMKRNQWRSPEELGRICERRFLSLLDYARKNVPFYQKRFEGAMVRSLEDARSLPITDKTDVRDNPGKFISREYGRSHLGRDFTSGSTGIQVPLYYTRAESAYGVAFETHHLTECGAGIFDIQARIAHYESRPNILQRLGVFRCRYLPVQAEETENLLRLAHIRPAILISYPSILLPLARINSAEGLDLRLKMILSGGESLSEPARKEISSSFACPIFDRYGSMESSWVAWECRKGSLHIQEDQALVEILGDDGMPIADGRPGSIVVTPLWRHAMPFIRYSLGDSGAFGPPCRCGRGLRTLRMVRGRQDDMIRLPSGRMRSARSINLMDDIPGMLAYQIVQEKPDLFIFRYVQAGGFGDAERKEVRRRIVYGCLGEKVRVEFEEAPSIGRGRTGKIRTVISRVNEGSGR